MDKNKRVNIYLDDLRPLPKEFDLLFKTGEDLLEYLKHSGNQAVGIISLDHDLGMGVMDGYDFVKNMVHLPVDINEIQLHTDNLVGFRNMYYYLTNAQAHDVLAERTVISPYKYRYQSGRCVDRIKVI